MPRHTAVYAAFHPHGFVLWVSIGSALDRGAPGLEPAELVEVAIGNQGDAAEGMEDGEVGMGWIAKAGTATHSDLGHLQQVDQMDNPSEDIARHERQPNFTLGGLAGNAAGGGL